MQTQIRLGLLEEQSGQCLHCLPFQEFLSAPFAQISLWKDQILRLIAATFGVSANFVPFTVSDVFI